MRQTEQVGTKRAGVILMFSCLFLACSVPVLFAEPIQSGSGQRQTPKAAIPAKPIASDHAKVTLPTFPKKFEVQGPQSDSFGFAVTQPGPIAVEVQAQGAPVIVTLQTSGGQPIIQKGTGLLRLFYNVTPQDVQRSLFWQIQIRSWCEDDCRTAGQRPRATGSVMVQYPPVDQATVQKAMRAMAAQQKQPSPQEIQSAGAQAVAQMEQAFQQRKAQFEQLQQQRRTALFSQIRPQVDQLWRRVGGLSEPPAWTKGGGASVGYGAGSGQVRPRGLEETAELQVSDSPTETQGDVGEIGTRGMPQIDRPIRPGMRMLSGQSTTQPPTFPQEFAVQGPESDSFGFAITQPGPIQVEVQSQGPPVIVTLQHLPSASMIQQGVGQVRLNYDVTAQDIQKSALWFVRVRLAQAGAVPASGTIMVQHPGGDPAVAQAQLAAWAEQERANRERTGLEAENQSRSEFQQFKATVEQRYQRRLADERTQNQAFLNRLRPQSGGMIRSRGLNPAISRINKSEGQPKTQVIIEGTNFGPGGEVVFQLGPNVVGTGIVEAWADTVIVANVPDASGLLPYQGTLAVRVGQTLSNAVPFKFIPVEEAREIRVAQEQDISLAAPSLKTGSMIEHPNQSFGQLSGNKGNDVFFPSRQFGNGWLVQEIKLKIDPCAFPSCRGAYVADSRIGTPSAFFNVRWWHEALVGARYWFSLWIVGPRGVPDGILNTGPLTPVVPPGTPPPATTASNAPAGRTPPEQPPYNPPASSQPIEMTVVPINPALIPQYQVGPGAGTGTTQNQPPAGQSGTKMAADPNNRKLEQVPPSSSSSMPSDGGTSMGMGTSTPPSQPPGPTTPVITSLSVSQGQPGDPVMITGSNFGTGLGEIHFVIANGRDVTAPSGAIWSDTQIFTSVPDASGLLSFNGTVYVKRTMDQKTSNLVPFRFEPTLELRQFRPTWPVRDMAPLQRTPSETICYPQVDAPNAALCVAYRPPSIFEGAKGTDQYFLNTRLTNGWVLDDVAFQSIRCIGGCNYLDQKAIGTDRLYFTVRWWVEAEGLSLHWSRYNVIWLTIRGPKGVSDGVVVP